MKRILIVLAITAILLASVATAADLTIQMPAGTFIIIEFGNTKLRVWDCGRVDRVEWNEIVPRSMWYIPTTTLVSPIGGGTSVTVP